jgi:hypothetical protein
MTSRVAVQTLVMVGLMACGPQAKKDEGGGNTSNSTLLAGFNPAAPLPGQLQFITPIIRGIQPGQDINYCTYLDFRPDSTLDVVSYQGFQSPGGHHTILYASRRVQAAGTHECTDNDMLNVRYIGGAGTDATVGAANIPEGIAFEISAGTQLMVMSHWINATLAPLDGQSAYNVTTQAPTPGVSPGDLFTVVNTLLDIPVGTHSAHTECVLQQDMAFFLIGGHAHEHATHITLTHAPASGPSTVMYDHEWGPQLVFDSPLNKYTKAEPYRMSAGDRFVVDCTYSNTTGANIPFPTEMCVGFGYYFPATAEMDCVDGNWPSP